MIDLWREIHRKVAVSILSLCFFYNFTDHAWCSKFNNYHATTISCLANAASVFSSRMRYISSFRHADGSLKFWDASAGNTSTFVCHFPSFLCSCVKLTGCGGRADTRQFHGGNPYFFSENLSIRILHYFIASMYRENVHAIHIAKQFAKKMRHCVIKIDIQQQITKIGALLHVARQSD